MKLLRLLHVASELAPFTGDSALGKENRFLSRALAELGVDVLLTVPGYAVPETARTGLARRLSPITVAGPDGAQALEITVHEGSAAGGRVAIVVIDLPEPGHNAASFCHAALEIARLRGAWPDVVLAGPGTEPVLAMARAAAAADLEPPATLYALRSVEDDSDAIHDALTHADRIVVSSPTWAGALHRDMAEHPGNRVARLLGPVQDAIRGVAPGIDTTTWNPRQDRHIIPDFAADPRAGKAHHKAELRRELGLRARTEPTALVAVLGPLDPNILTYSTVNELAKEDLQLVVLADPERDDAALRHVKRLLYQAPGQVVVPGFASEGERAAFEHRLLAAADFALLAHEFAPGGLSELHCMHYGAVPIAPATGNVADVVVEFDSLTATGNGFLFVPGDSDNLMSAVRRALHCHEKAESFAVLVQRIMEVDLSWRTPAQRYVNIILDMLRSLDRLAA